MIVVNWFLSQLQLLLIKVVDFLPKSPITLLDDLAISSNISDLLGILNWFIPVYSFISMLEVWLVAILAYYVVSVILRWLKVIE